ncbi:MAG: antitoxin VapB family protein [Thermoplasmata archaeon]|nr:antitoxin VapB family protein [Thermoplasmata archaeon]
MGVRTITQTDEAYRRLRADKGDAESFSDVVLRLTRQKPLSDFAGVLSHDSATALRSAVAEDRAERRRRPPIRRRSLDLGLSAGRSSADSARS